MKAAMPLKAFALALAIGSFGLAGAAMADDDDYHHHHHHDGDAAVGIIGDVIGGAIAVEGAKQEAREHARHCVHLRHRCDDGSDWACDKYEEICGD